MQRFYELSEEDKLRALNAMRAYLGGGVGETKVDRLQEERRLALEAIRTVAKALALPDGVAPTQAQFDAEAKKVAPGWNSNRVRRTWGRWRFACEAYRGGGLAPTAARQAVKRATTGRKQRSHEEYLVAIRVWLATKPADETLLSYNAWRREWNEQLPPGKLPAPPMSRAREAYGLDWEGLKKLARGESIEELPAPKRYRRAVVRPGPHDLVTIASVATILDLPLSSAEVDANSPDFPPPALIGGRRVRFWRRSDVVAYAEGRPFPQRRENELRPLYLDSTEVGKLAGVSRGAAVHWTARIPQPTVALGGQKFWLKEDAERALADWRTKQGKRAR